MEKPNIQVVDLNDQIVGYKPRNEVDFANEYYRVSALWLRNSQGQVLIAQRKLTKDKDPGKWGPAVAGTVEEGEDYSSNIVKEIEEEIGVTGLKLELGPKQQVTEPRHYFCQWWYGKSDMPAEDFILQEEEVEQVAWVETAKLKTRVEQEPETFVPTLPEALRLLETGLYWYENRYYLTWYAR